MKTIKVKIQGGRILHKIEVPTCWEEVTTNFFVRFSKAAVSENEILMLCAATNLKEGELLSANNTALDDEVFEALQFWQDVEKLKAYALPKQLKIAGQYYDVPKDLEARTLGQKLEIKALMQSKEEFFNNLIPAFITYFAPITEVKPNILEQHVKEMRIIDVFPVVAFFLRRYKEL